MANARGREDSSAGTDRSLSIDAILDALGHHHRRTMFRWLRRRSDQRADADELVQQLLDQERERTGRSPDPDRLVARLHHVHEPKLRELGLVTFEESTEAYQYHSNERLEKWLDLLDSEHESER